MEISWSFSCLYCLLKPKSRTGKQILDSVIEMYICIDEEDKREEENLISPYKISSRCLLAIYSVIVFIVY